MCDTVYTLRNVKVHNSKTCNTFHFTLSLGFEKRQAEVIVTALVTLTTANMDIVYRDMVTGNHQVRQENRNSGSNMY